MMNIIRMIFLFALLVALPSALAKEKEETVRYYAAPLISPAEDLFSSVGSSVSLRMKDGEVEASSGHSWIGGKMCGDKEWLCIRIPFMFNFSVNKKWKLLPAEWEYDSFKYQNVGMEKISIFGKEVEVYLICSSGGDDASESPTRDTCFNYSLKHGMLAVYLYDDGFEGETVTAYYAVRQNGLFARK
jgi:hypothetical protein